MATPKTILAAAASEDGMTVTSTSATSFGSPAIWTSWRNWACSSTFFLVADFARHPGNRPLIQRLVSEGHEVASHSLTHCIELCSLNQEDKAREIIDSKKILEDLTGQPVVGLPGAGLRF